MRAHRAGTFRLIQARLRAYDMALKSGVSSQEAYNIARLIKRKSLKKRARK